MPTKQQIIDEIKRTAESNGGKPLGQLRLQRETGIGPYDWGQFWARYGDLTKEAGFEPNQFKSGYDEDLIIEKFIGLIRRLGKFPTQPEIRLARKSDRELPDITTFQSRLGNKAEIAEKVMDYCGDQATYVDIVALARPILDARKMPHQVAKEDMNSRFGEVYLFKSGRYYKIGMTKDTVRRGSELRIQLPERMDLIHSIATDDPSGIEAYWHRRFESKRMNGEWFDLNSADIRSFKRWKRIF